MKSKKVVAIVRDRLVMGASDTPNEASFAEIVSLIEQARTRAYQAVNTELVGLYWQVGEYISRKLEAAEWGEGVVDRLALHLARILPGLRGLTRRNLFRMRQFYETYADNTKVSPLVTQLPWTHNLIILGQCNAQRNGSSTCDWRSASTTCMPTTWRRGSGCLPSMDSRRCVSVIWWTLCSRTWCIAEEFWR